MTKGTPPLVVKQNSIRCTDEENLARETDWIVKKENRPRKKRKANVSSGSTNDDLETIPAEKDLECETEWILNKRKDHKKEKES